MHLTGIEEEATDLVEYGSSKKEEGIGIWTVRDCVTLGALAESGQESPTMSEIASAMCMNAQSCGERGGVRK